MLHGDPEAPLKAQHMYLERSKNVPVSRGSRTSRPAMLPCAVQRWQAGAHPREAAPQGVRVRLHAMYAAAMCRRALLVRGGRVNADEVHEAEVGGRGDDVAGKGATAAGPVASADVPVAQVVEAVRAQDLEHHRRRQVAHQGRADLRMAARVQALGSLD